MLKTRITTFLALFILSVLGSTLAFAGQLTSTVNRNLVSTNETLSLRILYDQKVSSNAIDFDVLKRDFEVFGIRPQSNSSMTMINGKTTQIATTAWDITLVPKREGKLTIPAFSINGDSSQTIIITADNANSGAAGKSDQPLHVWVSSNAQSIVPGQELIIDVEISAATNVGDLSGPQLVVAGAEIESLGQQTFQRVDNGVARQIITLKYALFAKALGTLTIPVMTYSGVQGGRQSIFGRRGQQVVARSEQLLVAVTAKPNTGSKTWFPASKVTIDATWLGDKTKIRVGDPITRKITITAKGQRASAIPPLQYSEGDYKRYQDQPQIQSEPGTNGFTSTRIESAAIVPTKPGTLTLPPIKLKWWNVNSKQWETATVEAESIEILAATASSSPVNDEAQTNRSPAQSEELNTTDNGHSNKLWPLLSALLALIALAQTFIIWRLMKRAPKTPSDTAPLTTQHNEPQAWAQISKILNNGDAKEIRRDLLIWGQAALEKSSPISLNDLGKKSQELNTELLKLDKHLYSDKEEFNTQILKPILKELRQSLKQRRSSETKENSTLRSLYPG